MVEYSVIDRAVAGEEVEILKDKTGFVKVLAGSSAQFMHTLNASCAHDLTNDPNAGCTVYMQVSLKLSPFVVDSSIAGTAIVKEGFEEWISSGGMIGVSSDEADDEARQLGWTVEFPESVREV